MTFRGGHLPLTPDLGYAGHSIVPQSYMHGVAPGALQSQNKVQVSLSRVKHASFFALMNIS